MSTACFGPTRSPMSFAGRDLTGGCAAVIVHWRDARDTERCVRSLRADAPGMTVVVVDNGSDDGSGAAVGRALADLTDVEVLRVAQNRGFGAGCNLGFECVLRDARRFERVLLVNPDAIVEAGAVAALVDVAERHPDAGIVGGNVLSIDGERILFESGRFRPRTLGRCQVRAPAGAREHEVSFVTGALMLIDAGLLRAGLRFDERYFLYVEDLDLCCQVRARGRSLWVTRAARIRHRDGGSQAGEPPVLGSMRARQLEHLARGKVILARKWLTRPQRLSFYALAFVLRPLGGLWLARGVGFLAPYFRGLFAGLRVPLPGDRPRR